MKKLSLGLLGLLISGLIFVNAQAATPFVVKNGRLSLGGKEYILTEIKNTDWPKETGGAGITYLADRDPTASEPLEYGWVELNADWRNTVTNALFKCVDNTPDALKWDFVPSYPFNY